MSDQPVLPPEIEETIFSLALQTDWSSAKGFILVAKRVHEWLIPQIYKVRVYRRYPLSNARPLSDSSKLIYHGKYVRHILLHDINPAEGLPHQRPGECLALCPNIVDIALWITIDKYDEMLINQLLDLHLTHLSFNLDSFEYAIAKRLQILTPISFPHLTHLDVFGIEDDPGAELMISDARFPALTHLALNSTLDDPTRITLGAMNIFKDQLKLIIWYQGDTTNPLPAVVPRYKFRYSTPDDPRIVVLTYGYIRTWYEGAIGGLGLWRVAEEALGTRQRENEASVN